MFIAAVLFLQPPPRVVPPPNVGPPACRCKAGECGCALCGSGKCACATLKPPVRMPVVATYTLERKGDRWVYSYKGHEKWIAGTESEATARYLAELLVREVEGRTFAQPLVYSPPVVPAANC